MVKIFILCLCAVTATLGQGGVSNPGCAGVNPQQCLNLALEAMGGRQRLQEVNSLRLNTIAHTLLMEQSYRQEPFITSYEKAVTTIDFNRQSLLKESTLTWPESDANDWGGPQRGCGRAGRRGHSRQPRRHSLRPVYFPEHKLLYASDTLVINDDGSLYDPELMSEVERAVEREKLEVATVFAMHQGPTPWQQVVDLLRKAQHPGT